MRLRSIFRRSPHIHPSSGVGSGAPTSSSSATATVLNEPFSSVVHYLQSLLSKTKATLLIGDVNYCFYSEPNPLSRCQNLKLSVSMTLPLRFLTQEKFDQLVTSPTHIKGGEKMRFRHEITLSVST